MVCLQSLFLCRVVHANPRKGSLTECHKSPRDVFPQELSHLNGPNFLRVNVLLVIRDATCLDVSRVFMRFRQRADRVFFSLEKHHLRVEQEAALFRQVSRGPLDRENVKAQEQAPPPASSCEGDSDIQVFLPFSNKPGPPIGDSLTWGNEAMPVLLRPCSLIALRASLSRPPPQAIRTASAHSTLVG